MAERLFEEGKRQIKRSRISREDGKVERADRQRERAACCLRSSLELLEASR
jgi:hypothetical protein